MGSLETLKPKIVKILARNGVARAGVFGSYARGEETPDSDLDILVEFRGRKSLLDLARAERELEEGTNKKVDLVTYDSLNHLLRSSILADEVRIL